MRGFCIVVVMICTNCVCADVKVSSSKTGDSLKHKKGLITQWKVTFQNNSKSDAKIRFSITNRANSIDGGEYEQTGVLTVKAGRSDFANTYTWSGAEPDVRFAVDNDSIGNGTKSQPKNAGKSNQTQDEVTIVKTERLIEGSEVDSSGKYKTIYYKEKYTYSNGRIRISEETFQTRVPNVAPIQK